MSDRSRDKALKPTFRIRSKSSGPTIRPQPEALHPDPRGPAPDEVVPSTSRQVVGRTTLAGREVAVVSASPKWRQLVPPSPTQPQPQVPPYEDISSGSSNEGEEDDAIGAMGTRHSTESTWYQDLPTAMPQRPPKHPRDSSGDSLPPAQKPDHRPSPSTHSISPIAPQRTSSPIAQPAPTSPIARRDPRIVANEQREAAMRASGMSFASAASQPPSTSQQRSQDDAQPPPSSTDQAQEPPKVKIPPITVETLPNWTVHFRALKGTLGFAPNARPLGKGVRFLPKSIAEYRGVQKYLAEARQTDPRIIGHSYAVPQDRAHKVAITGLLRETPIEELLADLEAIVGVRPEFARAIPPRHGRPGTIFFVQFPHLAREEQNKLMGIQELLAIPNISVTAWVRRAGPPQCHRCQTFGHSSLGCFRPARCVRCAGAHPVSECDREHAAIKCANCSQPHAANSRACPAFRREARKTDANIPPPLPQERRIVAEQRYTQATIQEATQQGNLMAPARGPATRGGDPQPAGLPQKKRKTKKKKRRSQNEPPQPRAEPAVQPAPAVPLREALPPPIQAARNQLAPSQPQPRPEPSTQLQPKSLMAWPPLPAPRRAGKPAVPSNEGTQNQALRPPQAPRPPPPTQTQAQGTQEQMSRQQSSRQQPSRQIPSQQQPVRESVPTTHHVQPPSGPPPLMRPPPPNRPTPPLHSRTDPNGQPPTHRCGCSEERGRLMIQAAITVLLGVLTAVNNGQEPAEAILQGLVHLHTHLRG